jgi:hypothetical protein
MTPPTILHCCGNIFAELLPSNNGDTPTHILSFDETQTVQRMTHPNISSIFAYIQCHGNMFSEPLPDNEGRDIFY